jgi:hypothetical protein
MRARLLEFPYVAFDRRLRQTVLLPPARRTAGVRIGGSAAAAVCPCAGANTLAGFLLVVAHAVLGSSRARAASEPRGLLLHGTCDMAEARAA